MTKAQDMYTQAARNWSRRVCYPRNQRWMQTTKAGRTAAKEGNFKDEQTWGKQCFEDLEWRDLGAHHIRHYLLRRSRQCALPRQLEHVKPFYAAPEWEGKNCAFFDGFLLSRFDGTRVNWGDITYEELAAGARTM